QGEGVSKDDKEAFKWCLQAAQGGHVDAQNSLGYCYAEGLGVLKDFASAYAWYSIATFAGHAESSQSCALLEKEMDPYHIAKGQELAKKMLKEIEARKAKDKK
ncbi:MAG: tetratricopeptide repeat protein, partial [Opitutae bacterium]